MTFLLPLMGFLFISLLITAIGMSLVRGETAIERRLGELGMPGSLPAVPGAGNERLLRTLRRLGQAAPNPVLSTLRHFRQEYLTHIQDRACPSGVCPLRTREAVP